MVLTNVSPKKIYIYVEEEPITTAGIYHNSDLGLISLSSDGSTWLTIADKNLGATSTDITSTDSYGNLYQRGNNHGFPYAASSGGTITKSSTKVNASSYGPTNYYDSSTFIYSGSENGDWSSSQNNNLWGDTTNTNIARKGPCDTGFHVPTNTELTRLLNDLKTITNKSSITGNDLGKYILMPAFGRLSGNNGAWATNNYRFLWSSSPNSTTSYYLETADTTAAYTSSVGRAWGFSIRPFKNDAIQPREGDERLPYPYIKLKSYDELLVIGTQGIAAVQDVLNTYPLEYYNKLNSEGHLTNNTLTISTVPSGTRNYTIYFSNTNERSW